MLHEFWINFTHNLFKPLLLFFYLGFTIPLLRIKFEYPHALYQAITIYLLVAIGWHGGEELASVSAGEFTQAAGFMVVGFVLNFLIGVAAYILLRKMTNLRKVDAATVAGYYGSDSAGTFVTCLGVLAGANIAYAPYMPVMLAVMEIPGCLVALYLVSMLRHQGMDANGYLPDEEGYGAALEQVTVTHTAVSYQHTGTSSTAAVALATHTGGGGHGHGRAGHGAATATLPQTRRRHDGHKGDGDAGHGHGEHHGEHNGDGHYKQHAPTAGGKLNSKVLHEVFLNPGLYLLFGGILIGFISRLQGQEVTRPDDSFFVTLFQGVLCLFLLEMGITACKRLRDLRKAGWRFILFGLLAPNLFATVGITVAHLYSHVTGQPMALGTYVLFAVLCGAASYIAVPAVQRLAIPEASPTLPLAASLGLTFSYNVTVGIPVYIEVAKAVMASWPVA